ncbi:MAG: pantoate--beta-alanine ligase [Puniceicoccaceae bacterium]
MKVARSLEELKTAVEEYRGAGKRIALVPTMGYLHEGHLGLVDVAREHGDVVILTIFVNPTQFGPTEDLDAYPRDLERDLKLADARGVDLVFCPTSGDMYASDHSTYVMEESASLGLCGASRPGHFKGVLTVCCKLFNLTRCDVAVFGQKDAQQVTLIEKMVRELNMPLRIVRRATEREADGLAMSSRNAYLTAEQRVVAPLLQQALQRGRARIEAGECSVAAVLEHMRELLASEPLLRVDYLEIVDRHTLQPATEAIPGTLLLAGAVFVGKTRLIDNLEV